MTWTFANQISALANCLQGVLLVEILVTYTDGYYYESTINNNVWSPDEYSQGWEQIGAI